MSLSFKYNERANDVIIVQAGEYKGKKHVSIRTHFFPSGSTEPQATSKGVNIPIEEFPQFVADMNELLASMQGE